jgi:hypothetical protein
MKHQMLTQYVELCLVKVVGALKIIYVKSVSQSDRQPVSQTASESDSFIQSDRQSDSFIQSVKLIHSVRQTVRLIHSVSQTHSFSQTVSQIDSQSESFIKSDSQWDNQSDSATCHTPSFHSHPTATKTQATVRISICSTVQVCNNNRTLRSYGICNTLQDEAHTRPNSATWRLYLQSCMSRRVTC